MLFSLPPLLFGLSPKAICAFLTSFASLWDISELSAYASRPSLRFGTHREAVCAITTCFASLCDESGGSLRIPYVICSLCGCIVG